MAAAAPQTCRLLLVGFGNANRAFAQLLVEKQTLLHFQPLVVGILTGRSGWLVDKSSDGVDLVSALQAPRIADMPGARPGGRSPEESEELVTQLRGEGLLDVLVEAIPTNHETGEPALGLTRAALQAGVTVVTANKAPAALSLPSLQQLAAAKNCRYLYESACMDGIPIFNMVRSCLPTAQILSFEGILNSTTNVMLDELEKDPQLSFEGAVRVAQDMGIAETDPTADVDGWDAAVKCVCLARALGVAPDATLQDVQPVEGIRGLSGETVQSNLPKRFKLICRGSRAEDGRVFLSVKRELVPPSSPLHSVAGSSACLTLCTDVLGPLTLVQTSPTTRDTGFGLLADLCEACGQTRHQAF